MPTHNFKRICRTILTRPICPKMQFDAGAAAYKLRNYDKALEAFSQSLVDRSPRLQEKSRYNLGRTLGGPRRFRKTNEETLKGLGKCRATLRAGIEAGPTR